MSKMRDKIAEILESKMYELCQIPAMRYESQLYVADIILALFESQKEQWANHGSEMMASQIRKAIEEKAGRFSNNDANWILDRFVEFTYTEILHQDCLATLDKFGAELSQYQEMFERLEAKESCMYENSNCSAKEIGNNPGGDCFHPDIPLCNKGEITRPLTLEERKELIDFIKWYHKDTIVLKTGVRVVRVK